MCINMACATRMQQQSLRTRWSDSTPCLKACWLGSAPYIVPILPAWLRDALVQGLYSLSKNTVWIAKTRKDEWWDEIGWFTHNESHTGCPITETMVCRMHGHMPALFFYPDLERTSLEAFKHFQISDGEIPFSYGMDTSMRDPRYHCQHPLNSGQYAQMIYRLYLRSGDRDLLAHFYDSPPNAPYVINSRSTMTMTAWSTTRRTCRRANCGPPISSTISGPWWGTSAYVAGTWLATLSCGEAMATAMNDSEFAAECADWLERGKAAYEDKLWNGEYYRLWQDPANTSGEGPDCECIAGQSTDGAMVRQVQACRLGRYPAGGSSPVRPWRGRAPEYGRDGPRPGERRQSRWQSLRLEAGTPSAFPDILPNNDHSTQVFVGENLCAAMNFIYHGQRETGLEIARRIYEAVALTSRSPWKQRCLIDADSGLPVWGEDYYSDMVIWALPMACAGQSIAEFAQGDLMRDLLPGQGS